MKTVVRAVRGETSRCLVLRVRRKEPVGRFAVHLKDVEILGKSEQAYVGTALAANRHCSVKRRDDARVDPGRTSGAQPLHFAVVWKVLRRTPDKAHVPCVAPPGRRYCRCHRRSIDRNFADETGLRPTRYRLPGVRRAAYHVEDARAMRTSDGNRHRPFLTVDRGDGERRRDGDGVRDGFHIAAVHRVHRHRANLRSGGEYASGWR